MYGRILTGWLEISCEVKLDRGVDATTDVWNGDDDAMQFREKTTLVEAAASA